MTLWEEYKKTLPKKSTKPERVLYSTLDKLGIRYESQHWVGRYRADAYLPDYHLLIEVDGEYWHEKPRQQIIDRRKDQFYKSRGYKVARVWSKPFMRNPENWINGIIRLATK